MGTELATGRARLGAAQQRFERIAKAYLAHQRHDLAALGRQLHALSPLQTLERGYAIAVDEAGGAVRDSEELKTGQRLTLKFHRGEREVVVE